METKLNPASVLNTAATTPVQAPANPASLTTFEDCIAAIENAMTAADAESKQKALQAVHAFFKKRIARKASDREKDGTSNVRAAIAAARSLRPSFVKDSNDATDSKAV